MPTPKPCTFEDGDPTQVTGVGESTCFAPDRECLHYLIQGIREGFRVGFDRQSHLRSSEGNMTSAQEQATAVAKQLGKESAEPRWLVHWNGLASILIHLASFQSLPQASGSSSLTCPPVCICIPCSVSDGSIKELSSLSYISVDCVVEQVVRLGRGALLAKLDIQSTYRIVPVCSEDHCLLQVKWKRQLFVDCALLASGKPAKFYSTSRCSRVGCFSQRGTGHCTVPG